METLPASIGIMKSFALIGRKILGKHLNLIDIRGEFWRKKDPFIKDTQSYPCSSPYPYTIGIIKEFWHLHWYYIAACKDLRVKYKLIDISGPDWLDVIRHSGCDAFLVRPSVQLSIWKQMYEERLKIMVDELAKIIFPSYNELWFWESKRRMYYWLRAYGLPHPKTWIFYNYDEAMEFAKKADLPIVFKMDLGSGASGVIIIKKKKKLERLIKRCFRKGITTYRRSPLDKEWGFIILQEYLPDIREWRIVRIGDSYFGYEKLKVRDFHSGSHKSRHGLPPNHLLSFVRQVTGEHSFYSMAFDIFVKEDGRFFVNELQTHFGMQYTKELCIVDGQPGRMIFNLKDENWEFEPGDFCKNCLCNLRVLTLLSILERSRSKKKVQTKNV